MKMLHLDTYDNIHDRARRRAALVFFRFPVLLGRDPGADCRLESDLVSRRHARIDLQRGRLVVRDEGSRMGIWVHDYSRQLPVGVFLDLDSVGNEFSLGNWRVRAELRDAQFSAEAFG